MGILFNEMKEICFKLAKNFKNFKLCDNIKKKTCIINMSIDNTKVVRKLRSLVVIYPIIAIIESSIINISFKVKFKIKTI